MVPMLLTSRIQRVKLLFTIVGLLILIQDFFESFGRYLILGLEISEILISIVAVIYALILCLIAVIYPESILISHVQILRSKDLYSKIEVYQKQELKEDIIIDYLLSLPQDIFSPS